MIKVISIGTDRRVFEEGSAVRKRLLEQCKLFSELHVVVFARRSAGLRVEQHGNLWLYPTNSLSRFLYPRDASALVRGLIEQRGMTGADSVITTQDPFECGLAGLWTTRQRAKVPLHVQIHTDFLSPEFARQSFLNRIRVRLARRVLPRAAGIRVVSRRIADSISKSGIARGAPVSVLPVFSKEAIEWGNKPLRRYKPKRDASALVLMPSRLSPEKDFSTALHALQIARTRGAEARLAIVGEGPQEDAIEDEAQARGLSGAVAIEPWQPDLSSFYRVADIVLVTSRFEGYGLTLLEAAAHARPAVSTDVGIARELIRAPYERFVCPVGDAARIAEALAELSRNPALRQKFGLSLRDAAKRMLIPEADYWQRYRALLAACVTKSV